MKNVYQGGVIRPFHIPEPSGDRFAAVFGWLALIAFFITALY